MDRKIDLDAAFERIMDKFDKASERLIIEKKINTADLPVDPTGVPLVPGDPENCAGNGKGTFVFEDGTEIECCCDGCEYYAKCYGVPLWEL